MLTVNLNENNKFHKCSIDVSNAWCSILNFKVDYFLRMFILKYELVAKSCYKQVYYGSV